jgi:hypothetical protein
MIMINNTPKKPRLPTAYPKRKNRMAPRMVEMAVKNTGAVPNFFPELETLFAMLITIRFE